jgi:hypothetical protein
MCFGCKTVREYLPANHLSECPHAQLHLDTLKRLIGQPEVKEVTETVSSDEVESLKRQLAAAMKEIRKLKADLEIEKATRRLDEGHGEEDEMNEFLESRESGSPGWWDNPLYSHEMYLQDKKKCIQVENGVLVWKHSKWYKDDPDRE